MAVLLFLAATFLGCKGASKRVHVPVAENANRADNLGRPMKVDEAVRIAMATLEKQAMMPTNMFRLDARLAGAIWRLRFVFQPEAPDFSIGVQVRPDGSGEIMSRY